MDDTSQKDCIIFDIDGTIADHSHRAHHLQKRPKDWDAFNAGMSSDRLHMPIAQLLAILSKHYAIILCTGRQDQDREVTQAWLEQWGVPYTELHMRTTNDFRDDTIVKKELLHLILSAGWRPLFVVEDRNKVVKMWRDAGLVCLQCAEGDF